MIYFKKLRWKNFMSTGNEFTEINLQSHKSTLIVGQNGAGKSTLLDAMSFALFNKPHRNISKPQLVNSINGKECIVEIEFTIGKSNFRVKRGIKPAIFEIWRGDVMINQDSHAKEYQKILEQNIIKLNHKSFHQIVVLGSSSFIPFMQLNAQHRRDVIEDLLDINVFSKMNTLVKEKNAVLKEKLKDISHQLDLKKKKVVKKVEEVKEPVMETAPEPAKPEINLPENVEKLVKFMEETGGTVEDYVRLNADYSNINDDALIREYYKQTKPHLDIEEVNFLLEDNFSFDEEVDEERDIKKKKLAFKEEIAKARKFLEDTKSKYYDEIKLRPGVTQDQQKATDFFNRYNEDQKAAKQQHEQFVQSTKNLLNDDFKGFDFNVGEKKFRYGVKNVNEVAEAQSDISNFIGRFLDKKGNIADAKGYHKAMYAARNADTIAQHFYEQGKADAVKDVVAKSKNISTEPRKNSSGNVFINGLKVKAISGFDSSKLKVRTKKFN